MLSEEKYGDCDAASVAEDENVCTAEGPSLESCRDEVERSEHERVTVRLEVGSRPQLVMSREATESRVRVRVRVRLTTALVRTTKSGLSAPRLNMDLRESARARVPPWRSVRSR